MYFLYQWTQDELLKIGEVLSKYGIYYNRMSTKRLLFLI